MSSKNRRVVVTGMGIISPLGKSHDEYWNALIRGISGISNITLCDTDGFPNDIAGEVRGFDISDYIEKKEGRRMARFSQLAVAAAITALEDSKINLSEEDSGRLGVVMGNGNGGFPTTEENAKLLFEKGGMKVSPFFIPMILPNMASAQISRVLGLHGYTSTVITACAAGNQAIGDAAEAIKRGAADIVFAGGCEAGISRLGLAGFHVMKALSRYQGDPVNASRPFDAERDGFVPAEGAAVLVLEDFEHALKRGGFVLAEILGYGVSSDAFHVVQPDENGDGAARAMKSALIDAAVDVSEIDYINAHGTSTPLNDASETKAIKKVFGTLSSNIPISSTKSMTGHVLGGAGAIEAVAAVKTLENNVIHPTINYQTPDPLCDLDYVPNVARKVNVEKVLSNNFGFGGQNACIVFGSINQH